MAGIARTGADILRLRFGIERAVTLQIGPRRIRCLELLDREVPPIAEEAITPIVLQMERDPVLPHVIVVVPARGLTKEPVDGFDRAEQMGPAGPGGVDRAEIDGHHWVQEPSQPGLVRAKHLGRVGEHSDPRVVTEDLFTLVRVVGVPLVRLVSLPQVGHQTAAGLGRPHVRPGVRRILRADPPGRLECRRRTAQVDLHPR